MKVNEIWADKENQDEWKIFELKNDVVRIVALEDEADEQVETATIDRLDFLRDFARI